MDVYIPLAIYIVIVSYFFRKKKNIAIFLTFIPFLIFWGTKVDLGSDYGNYLYKYEMQHDMPFYYFLMDALDGKFEPGFFFLLKVMPSFNAVVFITSLFLISSVFLFFNEFIPKYSIYLALILWVFNSSIFNMFSAMRSSFVIGFFLVEKIEVLMRIRSVTSLLLLHRVLLRLFWTMALISVL